MIAVIMRLTLSITMELGLIVQYTVDETKYPQGTKFQMKSFLKSIRYARVDMVNGTLY